MLRYGIMIPLVSVLKNNAFLLLTIIIYNVYSP